MRERWGLAGLNSVFWGLKETLTVFNRDPSGCRAGKPVRWHCRAQVSHGGEMLGRGWVLYRLRTQVDFLMDLMLGERQRGAKDNCEVWACKTRRMGVAINRSREDERSRFGQRW